MRTRIEKLSGKRNLIVSEEGTNLESFQQQFEKLLEKKGLSGDKFSIKTVRKNGTILGFVARVPIEETDSV